MTMTSNSSDMTDTYDTTETPSISMKTKFRPIRYEVDTSQSVEYSEEEKKSTLSETRGHQKRKQQSFTEESSVVEVATTDEIDIGYEDYGKMRRRKRGKEVNPALFVYSGGCIAAVFCIIVAFVILLWAGGVIAKGS